MTTLEEITPGRALRAIRTAVKGRENFVYTSPDGEGGRCYYLHGRGDGNPVRPGCLIGHALIAEGVDPAILDGWEGCSVRVMFPDLAAVRIVLRAAQAAQDEGETWGEALLFAEERARALGVTDAAGNIIVD